MFLMLKAWNISTKIWKILDFIILKSQIFVSTSINIDRSIKVPKRSVNEKKNALFVKYFLFENFQSMLLIYDLNVALEFIIIYFFFK